MTRLHGTNSGIVTDHDLYGRCKDCLCSNLNYIIRRQVRVGVLFSIWIYLSCKYLFLVLWGLLRPSTTQASGQWWIEECIVIKLPLTGQGCSTDSGAEPWSWAKILELIHLQTTNIWAKLHSFFFHQWGFSDRGLSQNISWWYTYPVLIGWFTQQSQGDLSRFMSQSGCLLFTYRSLPTKQDVSYPGTSWALKLYLTPIKNGSFIQNGFSLVPSYTRHC